MKIAIATDDGRTISPHFGQAKKFVVITIGDGLIIFRETLANHQDSKRDGLDSQHKLRDDTCGEGFGRQSVGHLENLQECFVSLVPK